jgi:fructuronate reductase
VDDIAPYERRKLWLLNAGHSLLAYHGLAAGHRTVADAVADPRLSVELEQLWSEQRAELPFDAATVDDALAALRSRFGNARIGHHLAQIASDGSQKLGPRIVDPLRARLASGREPGAGQLGVLAAWSRHLAGPDVRDAGADSVIAALREAHTPRDRAAAVLASLAPDLTDLTEPLAERIAASDPATHQGAHV